jgi:aspartate-semialdehyde dehydrogenase
MAKYNLAIVGATGAVGQEMIKTAVQRKFPFRTLRLFASSRSRGKRLKAGSRTITVEELTEHSFDDQDIQIALFSAGADRSRRFAPLAARNRVVVIDNSSAFRMDRDVPLVVPEVNPHHLKKECLIIANPNCSTIQMVLALQPIHDAARITRVVVSTYQAVSGAGAQAMEELRVQTGAALQGRSLKPDKFPWPIAFNCIPQIDSFLENGYTKEEMKMVHETKKIMGDDSIQVTATTVRVPVFKGHSESINIETKKKITRKQAMELMKKAPGIRLVDNTDKLKYPLAIDAAEKDETLVGRIREDESIPHGLNLWVVSDNLRKGAALNAVQIAEQMIKDKLI